MNFKKLEVYGNPTLRQGGWGRTGEGNEYIKYSNSFEPTYAYRICTLDYVPQHHPTQITVTGIASKELEVSVLVLRSDNYIIATLGWQENGYTFNLGSTYDKLGVMFRFKNGDAITPNHVSFDIIGGWHDTPHYIHNTATDTLTTLPADIYANDNNATVSLKGNTVQNGTPTPDSPIQPNGCGERTNNLFDYISYFSSSFVTYNGYFNYADIQLIPNTTYSFSTNFNEGITYGGIKETPFIVMNGTDTPSTAIGGLGNNTIRILTTDNSGIVRILKRTKSNSTADIPTLQDFQNGKWIMCNEGSTVLPYEPYGIKIPILNNSQTTNVYLGETESTRRIKKLVLTGEETIRLQSINEYNIANFYISLLGLVVKDGLSSHFEKQTTIIGQTQTEGYFLAYSAQDTTLFIRISVSRASTTTEMQTWLSNQYTNGTPVTFWYTTEEPTTGIVNEPIRKIGDYADEVSNISIPTIAGANTVDVLTTLKPSEVSVNYHGWHPIADVYKRESGQWD